MRKKRVPLVPVLSFAAFILCLFFLFYMAARPGVNDAARQEERLYSAVWRATLHCYAVEGRYPPSLSYMEEVYGLQVNEKEFIVEYDRPGGNIAPRVSILRIQK